MKNLLDSPSASETAPPRPAPAAAGPVLVLGIGNVLMGDEGVGVHAVRWLEAQAPIAGVRLLDGGTGGVNLLTDFEGVNSIILVDATRDGCEAGTIQYHYRRHGGFGKLPPELGAHDFGLKDLFAAAALTGVLPEVHLYTIAIETIHPMTTELSPEVVAALHGVVRSTRSLAERLAAA